LRLRLRLRLQNTVGEDRLIGFFLQENEARKREAEAIQEQIERDKAELKEYMEQVHLVDPKILICFIPTFSGLSSVKCKFQC
jgi:hypothetical protein